jgi:RNA polymerase sigma-70 factor (ECF subfamily)
LGGQKDEPVRQGQATGLAGQSDEELLTLVVEQKREALEALYGRYGNAVYSLALHILRDPGAAEEVAQDSFFNVWRRAAIYRNSKGTVSAWLFSIVHHRAVDELRRRKRREQQQSDKDPMTLDHPADDTTDPVRFTVAQFDRVKIKGALEALRPEQREIVVLAYYGGLTHTEIAAKLGQPLGTVKTRMRLALKKLREVLGPQTLE